jgi:hypothetical protein
MAVTTAARSAALPDIPTVDEFVPSHEASQWYGIGAPKNTPAEIIDKLNNEINAALVDPNMKARLADLGASSASQSLRAPSPTCSPASVRDTNRRDCHGRTSFDTGHQGANCTHALSPVAWQLFRLRLPYSCRHRHFRKFTTPFRHLGKCCRVSLRAADGTCRFPP